MKTFLTIFMVMITLSLMTVGVHPAQAAATGTAILNWGADNLNTDGSQDTTLSQYKIYSAPTTTGSFSVLAVVPTSITTQVTTYTDTVTLPAPNASLQKCYELTAVNGAGESGPSNIVCKTFFGPTVLPSNPAGLTVQ